MMTRLSKPEKEELPDEPMFREVTLTSMNFHVRLVSGYPHEDLAYMSRMGLKLLREIEQDGK